MTTTTTLAERLSVLPGVAPQDITTDRIGAYHPVSGHRRIMAQLVTGTVAATQVATIQLLQATDDQGAGSTPVGDPVTVTAPAGGAELVAAVEGVLGAGYTHVAVKVTCDNATAVQGAAVLILGDGRYRP